MLKSVSQVGADIPDKIRYLFNKSDIIIVVQEETDPLNPIVENVRNNWEHKALYFTVKTKQVTTAPAVTSLKLGHIMAQLGETRNDLVLTCVGTHQDNLKCNEASQYRMIHGILAEVVTSVGVDRISHVLCGNEHGPELMSGRAALELGCHVRVVACAKFKARRYGAMYESSEEKIKAYISGSSE